MATERIPGVSSGRPTTERLRRSLQRLNHKAKFGLMDIKSTGGLVFDSSNGGLAIKLATNSGLTLGASGVGIQPNQTNSGLTIDGNGIRIGLSDTSLVLAGATIGVKLATDPGLEVSTGLRVKVKSSGGITRDSDGLSVLVTDFSFVDANSDIVFKSYNDAGRPTAGTAGRTIWNTDDAQLNIDDGAQWTLPDGTAT